MGGYINPIPYIGMAKDFEVRLKLHFDNPVDVEAAKDAAAEYIKNLPKEELKI